jgi:hypothetical protein
MAKKALPTLQPKNKAPMKQLNNGRQGPAKQLTNGKNKAPIKQARNSTLKGAIGSFKAFISGK